MAAPISIDDTPRANDNGGAVVSVDAASLVLRVDLPDGSIPIERFSRRPMAVSLCMATLLHASVGWALIAGEPERHGAGGVELDAVSVEVVVLPARAIESRVANATSAATAQGAIDRHEGVSEASPPATEAEPPEQKTAAAPEPSPAERKPQETNDIAPEPPPEAPPPLALLRAEALPVAPDEPLPPDAPHRPFPREAEKPTPPEQRPSPPSSPAGGAPAQATDGAKRLAAAATASRGDIRAYTRSIVDALASTRPKRSSRDPRGTVRVAFAVAEGGGLDFVRIAQSSGNAMLDEAALAAVRKATLPAPPPGLTLTQRTFVMPYYFR